MSSSLLGSFAFMNRKYEIVKYTPEFKGQVVELQKHLWSADPEINSAYLEWKYERNPYLHEPRIYLVMCDDRVVGMRGLYGAKWEIGSPSQRFLCPCSGDLVIAPDHRRQGLVYKLLDAIADDPANSAHEYIFSLSASPATYVASVKTGWRSVGPLQTHERVRKVSTVPNSSLDSRIRRTSLGRLYSRARRKLGRLVSRSRSSSWSPFDVFDRAVSLSVSRPEIAVGADPDPKSMADLVLQLGGVDRVRHVRDHDYFEWRFKNPLCSYRFLYWKAPALEGYLILQAWLNPKRAGTVHIVDWEATTPTVAKNLLKAALLLGNFELVKIWSGAFCDQMLQLLDKEGFRLLEGSSSGKQGFDSNIHRGGILIGPVRKEMLTVSEWTLGGHRLLDAANWDWRMLYSDDF